MPKRNDIQSILIIGAGPIVIGQPVSSTIPVRASLQGVARRSTRVILVNSNPATIMTDPEMADATYIEPITLKLSKKSSLSAPMRCCRQWAGKPR